MLTDPAPDVPGARVSDELADPAPEVLSEHPRFLGRKNEITQKRPVIRQEPHSHFPV